MFYNLSTKGYVRRTWWKKLPINQLVISQMNELAGAEIVLEQYVYVVEEAKPEGNQTVREIPGLHLPLLIEGERTAEAVALNETNMRCLIVQMMTMMKKNTMRSKMMKQTCSERS